MQYLACHPDSVSAIATQARVPFSAQQRGKASTQAGNVVTIYLHGPLSRDGDYTGGTSTEAVAQQLREAADNPAITGVLLVINSAGGVVQGTSELARAVRDTVQRKAVVAYVQDVAASAAYWVASQCSRIACAADAIVGSIGTVAVVVDSSRAADKAGFKVYAIRADATSEHKTTGYPGLPISSEQLQQVKHRVEAFNLMMLRDVGYGRGLSGKPLSRVADGRVYMAREALQLGLVDEIGPLETATAYVTSGRVAAKRNDAITAWTRTVDGIMELQRVSRSQATRYAMQHCRQLHEEYVAACNGRLVAENQAADGQQKDISKTWFALLRTHRANGLTAFEAFAEIERTHPGLRMEYVRAASAQ